MHTSNSCSQNDVATQVNDTANHFIQDNDVPPVVRKDIHLLSKFWGNSDRDAVVEGDQNLDIQGVHSFETRNVDSANVAEFFLKWL